MNRSVPPAPRISSVTALPAMSIADALPLPADFASARQSFATRRVPLSQARSLIGGARRPQVGDLVLARVLQLGQHRNVELVTGRKAALQPDHLVVLAYGNRYAPDQFEALVPPDLGPCDMVAGGGLAAREVERHAAMGAPTRIRPLGLLADADGRALNLRDYRLPPAAPAARRPRVVVVCGTSMNAGKTHTVAMTVRGLVALGQRVGAIKVTGTGSGNDLWRMHDAGAVPVLDFVDAGWPSTYGTPLAELERCYRRLVDAAAADGAQTLVIEIADGLGQAETAGLLRSTTLRQACDAVIFAACDPLGAAAGVDWLRQAGLPLVAVSGLTTADAASLEETRDLLDLPVLSAEQLAQGLALESACAQASAHHAA
jgi:hypothetical protein